MPPRLLVLDSSYTLRTLRENQQMQAVLCRDLDGFFEHVWSVHPLVGAAPGDDAKPGPIRETELSPRHTFVETPVGRWSGLRWATPANFVAAQLHLVGYLSRLIRKERIAAIRIGEPYLQGLIGLWLARRHGLPLILRINGNYDRLYESTGQQAFPRLFPSRSAEKRVERRVLQRADLVVAPNQDNLDFALRNGATADKAKIFPYGNLVHPIHFTEPSSRSGGQRIRAEIGAEGRQLLLYVGRLEPVKHTDHLVDIMHQVTRSVPNAKLVITGDGTQRASMEAEARQRGISESIHFAGTRNQEWIASLLPEISAVVATHMGRALAETALGGAPIVAYDLDWHSELVVEGKTGHLTAYPRRDVMAAAIVRILQEPGDARDMGKAARERAIELMHPDRLQARERDAYAALLGLTQTGPGARIQSAEVMA